jgi:hypothetical protein
MAAALLVFYIHLSSALRVSETPALASNLRTETLGMGGTEQKTRSQLG